MKKSLNKKEKVISPFADRDLHVRLAWPTLSWSSMSSFIYDNEDWYQKYYLGIRSKPNAQMQGGIDVGERLIIDPAYLLSVPRPEIYEQEFFAKLGKIQLTGHLDGWSPSVPELLEYKTTSNPKRWNKKSVDEWGQLSFYALLIWLNLKVSPESLKVALVSIPMVDGGDFSVVQQGTPTVWHTQRTMKDILLFAQTIRKTYKEMEEFIHSKALASSVHTE